MVWILCSIWLFQWIFKTHWSADGWYVFFLFWMIKNEMMIIIILLLRCVQKLQIVLAECEKRKEEVWITIDFSVAAQVMQKWESIGEKFVAGKGIW